jgi:hypothetical protein
MANNNVMTPAKMVQKQLQHYYNEHTMPQSSQELPKTALGLWVMLNDKGHFTSNWDGQTSTWQPDASQWLWFRWAVQQQGASMFLGARGIGKTEVLTVFRLVYEVVQDPACSILVITGTAKRGVEIIRLVHNMLSDLGIPLVGEAKTSIRTQENRTRKHPTVYCSSIGSKMKGDHPDLIIIEDPLDEKDMYSSAQKDRVMLAINEARRMAAERVFLIGQFVAEDDPYAQLCRQNKLAIYTAWANQVPHLIRTKKEDFVVQGNVMLEYSWGVNMEGRFLAKEGELFSKIETTAIYPSSGLIGVLDPAFGKGDATALALGGLYFDEDLQKEVLVAWVYSWNKGWHEVMSEIASLATHYRLDKVWYEGESYQDIGATLGDLGIDNEGFNTTINKQYKIEHVSAYAGRRLLRLHESNNDAMIDLIRRWHTKMQPDDQVDALAMLAYRLFDLGDKAKVKTLWSPSQFR